MIASESDVKEIVIELTSNELQQILLNRDVEGKLRDDPKTKVRIYCADPMNVKFSKAPCSDYYGEAEKEKWPKP